MSFNHPLAPKILPHCRKFPDQAAALFQSFVDLSLAQQWRDLEVVELDQCSTVVLRGRPKTPAKAPPAIVLPMNLHTPTSLASLDNVLKAVSSLESRQSEPPERAEGDLEVPSTEQSTTIYLAIVERDSSIVYYVLRQGIVSPKEVPE
ncbi:hypothetical protein JCM10212_004476 [Sporobolomyces blumeae]